MEYQHTPNKLTTLQKNITSVLEQYVKSIEKRYDTEVMALIDYDSPNHVLEFRYDGLLYDLIWNEHDETFNDKLIQFEWDFQVPSIVVFA